MPGPAPAPDLTAAGQPVYARFVDRAEAVDDRSPKLRTTAVFRSFTGHLQITTTNNRTPSEYRPTRLTPEEARALRDAIDAYLAGTD